MEKGYIDNIYKTDNKLNDKRDKMFNQIKRIIELSDTVFNSLADEINKNMGEEAKEVLQELYKENSTH